MDECLKKLGSVCPPEEYRGTSFNCTACADKHRAAVTEACGTKYTIFGPVSGPVFWAELGLFCRAEGTWSDADGSDGWFGAIFHSISIDCLLNFG